ncbi:MAG: prepilin-type N-terminal cleavage/methylation domain-containing protein [Lachnospiraceae bacterium]|nr:prepilin-type N-terminal cleavage/methylation domain-containing protein [Lachnospiraceae bacterium]
MKNNKGFSLVELLVTFAIAAIVGVAIFGFMSFSSNSFRQTSTDVGLQYEQQIVVNQVRDVLLEASNAVGYDDATKSLYVYSQVMDTSVTPAVPSYVVEKIYLNDEHEIYMAQFTYNDVADVKKDDVDGLTGSLMAEEVEDITFDLSDIDKNIIKFTISFKSGDKIITSDQIVALRNVITTDDDPTNMFVTNLEVINSFIDHITIERSGTVFAPGATDTIQLANIAGETTAVTVPYKANVYTKAESERIYEVKWSLANEVTDMSVNAATGAVYVGESVPDGTTNTLVATAVDDPTKFQTLNIRVESGGVYPVSVNIGLKSGDEGRIDYPGYTDYYLTTKITYTDGTVQNDPSLCTWVISGDKLPSGCSYDNTTGIFRVVPAANGKSFTFKATVKKPKIDGVRPESNSLTINVADVREYKPNQKLALSGAADSTYNNRGTNTYISAVWSFSDYSNATPLTDFSYHWEITPVGDNWDDSKDKDSFSKTMSIVETGNSGNITPPKNKISKLDTDASHRAINVYAEEYLDWGKAFIVKVTCYATDKKDNRYGIGNDIDRNYDGPVEMELAYDPVKMVLIPVTAASQNSSNNYKFIADSELKMASDGDKEKTGEYKKSKKYEGKTIREFEVRMRGVVFNQTYTNNITINSPTFVYYSTNASDGNTVTDADATCKLNPSNRYTGGSSGHGIYLDSIYTGFYVNLNSNSIVDNWFPMSNGLTVGYMSAIFTAKDNDGNFTTAYYLTGEDFFSDEDLTPSNLYKYKIRNLKGIDKKEAENWEIYPK